MRSVPSLCSGLLRSFHPVAFHACESLEHHPSQKNQQASKHPTTTKPTSKQKPPPSHSPTLTPPPLILSCLTSLHSGTWFSRHLFSFVRSFVLKTKFTSSIEVQNKGGKSGIWSALARCPLGWPARVVPLRSTLSPCMPPATNFFMDALAAAAGVLFGGLPTGARVSFLPPSRLCRPPKPPLWCASRYLFVGAGRLFRMAPPWVGSGPRSLFDLPPLRSGGCFA